jgi:hypothetical protein
MASMRCTLFAAAFACSFAWVPLDIGTYGGVDCLDQVSLAQVKAKAKVRVKAAFQESEEFLGSAFQEGKGKAQDAQAQKAHQEGTAQGKLPYGVASPPGGSPGGNWNPSMEQYGNWPYLDVPKDGEYSLDYGDTIRSYSPAKQDIKILTQLFQNITNGFYVESHAGDGEHGSNSLLFELVGWRGLLMEPRIYQYIAMWGKFRKAWLFMGGVSPTHEHIQVGFDINGDIDMLSGHMVQTHPMPSFLEDIGNRKTIDFWSLNNGGYEPEVLNTTLHPSSGYHLEVGVICVTMNHRLSGRGHYTWSELRSRDDTEELLFQTMHNLSWNYIGGLNAKWINTIVPRWYWQDAVFVNPAYFTARGLPVPTTIKSAPPNPLEEPDQLSLAQTPSHEDHIIESWDEGYTHEQETAIIVDYIRRSKIDAESDETVPKAHRVEEQWLWGAEHTWTDPRHM